MHLLENTKNKLKDIGGNLLRRLTYLPTSRYNKDTFANTAIMLFQFINIKKLNGIQHLFLC